ncbi:MAG: FAD-dependent oxidoreductase [Pseudomonadota bacterium]
MGSAPPPRRARRDARCGGDPTLEPALAPRFSHGYFIPDWGHVQDPYRVTTRLADHLRARGGDIQTAEVRDIAFADGRPQAVVTAAGATVAFDQLVVCAGAWSRPPMPDARS